MHWHSGALHTPCPLHVLMLHLSEHWSSGQRMLGITTGNMSGPMSAGCAISSDSHSGSSSCASLGSLAGGELLARSPEGLTGGAPPGAALAAAAGGGTVTSPAPVPSGGTSVAGACPSWPPAAAPPEGQRSPAQSRASARPASRRLQARPCAGASTPGTGAVVSATDPPSSHDVQMTAMRSKERSSDKLYARIGSRAARGTASPQRAQS